MDLEEKNLQEPSKDLTLFPCLFPLDPLSPLVTIQIPNNKNARVPGTVYLIAKATKTKTAKKCRTMQFKGQAGSAVFRHSSLLPNSQVDQSWLLQIPLAPDCGR